MLMKKERGTRGRGDLSPDHHSTTTKEGEEGVAGEGRRGKSLEPAKLRQGVHARYGRRVGVSVRR